MSWRDVAACRDMDPDLFFPTRSAEVPPAAALACARCTVRDECLADALADGIRHGVRAGLSAVQLRELRKRPRRRAVHDRGPVVAR